MSRRSDELLPLTHDHHHALVQARALIKAANSDLQIRVDASATFLRFYREETLLHFHEEEEMLFPKLLEHTQEPPPELIQVLIDHVRIHGMVGRLQESLARGAPDGQELKALGETLRAHVRLEEGKLFPAIEEVVPEDDLRAISFVDRDR